MSIVRQPFSFTCDGSGNKSASLSINGTLADFIVNGSAAGFTATAGDFELNNAAGTNVLLTSGSNPAAGLDLVNGDAISASDFGVKALNGTFTLSFTGAAAAATTGGELTWYPPATEGDSLRATLT